MMADLNMVKWHYMWLKTIARAWAIPSFASTLVSTDPGVVKTQIQIANSVNGVPTTYWPFPDWVQLIVQDPKGAAWKPELHFWNLQDTDVTMYYYDPPA